jgi:hypothetical protein
MLDQIMVSKGLLTGNNELEVADDSFTIFRPKRIRDGSKPKPFRMKNNNTLVEGFSDHFTVLAKINIL